MLRQLRETGPVALVPLAWGFAAAAHLRWLAPRTVLIGHLVMATLLFGFAALSWREMRAHPVLRAWLAVIVVGFGVTTVGAYALATDGPALWLRGTVFGWMVLPAVALVYTGAVLPADEAPRAYTLGGALSGLGAMAFVAAPSVGMALTVPALALVGVGQTVGIVTAVLQY